MDWKWIGDGLALDWHQIGIPLDKDQPRLALDRQRIGAILAKDWLSRIGNGLASDWQ